MNKFNDEILNKYIDGELDFASLQQVNNILANSAEDKRRINALLTVHNELKKIKEEATTANFTFSLMKKLRSTSKSLNEQRVFIFSVTSIFVFMIILIITALIVIGINQPGEISSSQEYNKFLIAIINHIVTFTSKIFSPKGISIIGSILSLGILISGYFFYENLKATKHKVQRLS